MENWKEIEGTNGIYYVSDLGNVKKVGGKQFKYNGTNLKLCKINSGYLIAKMYVNHKHIQRAVHRLVAETFLGKCEGLDVNHKNGNKQDNRLENLEWCSRKENMEHCSRNGLRKDIKKVMAIKNGVCIAKADFSRELAEKLSDYFPDTQIETVARKIRMIRDTGKTYNNFQFISF